MSSWGLLTSGATSVVAGAGQPTADGGASFDVGVGAASVTGTGGIGGIGGEGVRVVRVARVGGVGCLGAGRTISMNWTCLTSIS